MTLAMMTSAPYADFMTPSFSTRYGLKRITSFSKNVDINYSDTQTAIL